MKNNPIESENSLKEIFMKKEVLRESVYSQYFPNENSPPNFCIFRKPIESEHDPTKTDLCNLFKLI